MGILFGLGWLVFGLWRRSRELQKVALVMFVVAAVLAVPLYLTGEPGVGVLKGLPGFSDRVLEQHEASAGAALAGCIVLGILGLTGHILFRGRALRGGFAVLLLLVALLVGSLMAWTANLGGQIRHSEIRALSR